MLTFDFALKFILEAILKSRVITKRFYTPKAIQYFKMWLSLIREWSK